MSSLEGKEMVTKSNQTFVTQFPEQELLITNILVVMLVLWIRQVKISIIYKNSISFQTPVTCNLGLI